jgi:hypothetical protein
LFVQKQLAWKIQMKKIKKHQGDGKEKEKDYIEILTIMARKPEVKVQQQASKFCLAQANFEF